MSFFKYLFLVSLGLRLSTGVEASVEIEFSNNTRFTSSISGGVKFVGNAATDSCIFSGSAAGEIEIHKGNIQVSSATPLGTHGVNMTGGSLEVLAGFTPPLTLPPLTMTNAAIVKADADGVHVATASGSGGLTLAGLAGTEAIYLDEIASSGGISSAINPVHLTSLTNLHANAGTFNVLNLDSLPTGNVYGTGAVTAASIVVGTNIPAGVFGSLTTHLINLGANNLSQPVIAN